MKVKKFENVQDKSGLKGCNWSSLNVPGTESLMSNLMEHGTKDKESSFSGRPNGRTCARACMASWLHASSRERVGHSARKQPEPEYKYIQVNGYVNTTLWQRRKRDT